MFKRAISNANLVSSQAVSQPVASAVTSQAVANATGRKLVGVFLPTPPNPTTGISCGTPTRVY